MKLFPLRSVALLGLIAFISLPGWSAATFVPPANLTQFQTINNCTTPGGVVLAPICSDTTYLSGQMANWNTTFISPNTFNGVQPTNQTFQTAFANGAAGWNIINGGTLDLTLTVTQANYQDIPSVDGTTYLGGMSIDAVISNYMPGANGPSLGQLAWTQALYINYSPGSAATTPANPAVTLDTYAFSGGNGKVQGKGDTPFTKPQTPIPPSPPCNSQVPGQCTPSTIPNNITGNDATQQAYDGPIYPFQGDGAGTNKNFFDAPAGFYQTPASFRAIALLSTVDTVTHTITVYNDGISYGFDLALPEPILTLPIGALFGCLLLLREKLRRKTDVSGQANEA